MAKYYYNNVLLPEIPSNLLAEYPYFMITEVVSTGAIFVHATPVQNYYNTSDNTVYLTSGRNSWMYNAESEIWEEFKIETVTILLYMENIEMVWSNHDIYQVSNGIPTIYFEASDPIPEVPYEMYSIQSTTLTSFADQARRISGRKDVLTPSQMLGIFEGASGSGGGYNLNIHYGDTAPDDTSMLWCKCDVPSGVLMSSHFEVGDETMASNISSLPVNRTNMGVGVVGSKIYLFGGAFASNSGRSYYDAIYVFDAETNTVTTLEVTLPTKCSDMGVGVVGSKIYLFGGRNSSGSLQTINVFDSETKTISTLSATISSARYGIGVGVVGTKIYLFGGTGSSKAIQVFDTETNTISTLSTTLPQYAYDMGVGVVGARIYLFGGYGSSRLRTIYVFDTETYTISTLSVKLPTACDSVAVGEIGTKIYIFGGYAGTSNLNTINVFDTEANTISTLDAKLLEGTYGMRAGVVGTNIFLFGGFSSSTLNRIDKFSVSFELLNQELLLSLSQSNNIIEIMKGEIGLVIGVDTVYIGNSDNKGEYVDSYLYRDGTWTQI